MNATFGHVNGGASSFWKLFYNRFCGFQENYEELVSAFTEATSKSILQYLRNFNVKKCKNYQRSFKKYRF
jgi:hypothetical protein